MGSTYEPITSATPDSFARFITALAATAEPVKVLVPLSAADGHDDAVDAPRGPFARVDTISAAEVVKLANTGALICWSGTARRVRSVVRPVRPAAEQKPTVADGEANLAAARMRWGWWQDSRPAVSPSIEWVARRRTGQPEKIGSAVKSSLR